MSGIVCTLQDITSSLYDLKPPCLCHRTNYIWHCAHCICVITSTVLMISHKLYFWDHICYNSRHHIPCIWHDSNCMSWQSLHSWHQIPYIWHHLQGLWHLVPIHVTSQPLSVSSHPLYRQHHNHSLYDITLSICVASFALYKTSHPHFMTSNHRVYVSTPTIFDIVPTVSVSSHPLY